MKILFIAPLPPPITGHSLVSKVLYDALLEKHSVVPVDLSKDSFKEGVDGMGRILQVGGIIKDVWRRKKGADACYLTISESFAGNVKDLFIYLVCYRRLSTMYIHLHGGSIKRLLWDKHPMLARVNKFFIKKFAGAIISGKSHIPVFADILPAEKIHIIPNFAQDYIFTTAKNVEENFTAATIRILYMSNLIPKKGYNELADAFIIMSEKAKSKIQLDFAGGFESDEQKDIFLQKIAPYSQVTYHGIVNEEKKKQLFEDAHIFCLPTSYFEGQPISILEAYASGCVVVTTGPSGILDIFQPHTNGYLIEPGSVASIKEVVEEIIEKKDEMRSIALNNLTTATQQYRTAIYTAAVQKVIEGR